MKRAVPFLEGERVAHVLHGDGVVSLVTMDRVTVTYDTGHRFTYDDAWFAAHPKYLFHRNTSEAEQSDV